MEVNISVLESRYHMLPHVLPLKGRGNPVMCLGQKQNNCELPDNLHSIPLKC